MSQRKKVFIIGMDGFTWRLGRHFMAEGIMPNLAHLVLNGCHGNLMSVMPYETSAAWSSIQTGCYPGKTGVFGFHKYDREKIKVHINSFNDILVPSIWELASDAGKTVVNLNMPISAPPPQVNGVIIPGLLCFNLSSNTYPSSAYGTYIKKMPQYRIVNMDHTRSLEQFVKNQIVTEKQRYKVARKLIQDIDWDMFFVQIQSTDHLQHDHWWALDKEAWGYCPKAHREVLKLYKVCDGIIGNLIREIGNDALKIVISDHGFCPKVCDFCLNTWLLKKGYLNIVKPEDSPTEEPVKSDNKFGSYKNDLKGKVPPIKYLAKLYGKTAKTIKKIMENYEKIVPDKLYCQKDLVHLRQLIDYSDTKAFALGGMGGMVYVLGTVGQRREIRAKLKAELLRDHGPQSENPVLEKIHNGEEYYKLAANAEMIPDLVVELRKGVSLIVSPAWPTTIRPFNLSSRYFKDKQPGTHEPEGVVVINGPGVHKGQLVNGSIVDVAPTALSYLGVPLPDHMDGTVLQGAFEEPLESTYEKSNFTRKSESPRYSEEEQAQMEKNLADLGYM